MAPQHWHRVRLLLKGSRPTSCAAFFFSRSVRPLSPRRYGWTFSSSCFARFIRCGFLPSPFSPFFLLLPLRRTEWSQQCVHVFSPFLPLPRLRVLIFVSNEVPFLRAGVFPSQQGLRNYGLQKVVGNSSPLFFFLFGIPFRHVI